MEKPTKPKHYYLIYTLILAGILACGLFIMFMCRIFSIRWFDYLGLPIIIILSSLLPKMVFKRYDELNKSYLEYIAEKEIPEREKERIRLARESNVNHSIEKYLAKQRKKREEAKWWQVWI